ncbi:DUF2798 domain-containing protein [Fructobacillus ficulneus]|uniref:Membrane protein n=1 Tax=Fructobacillus ficulneus TaxID=157463 RepID=A0A0K8MK96_9LACO|nr:DUF2798 domain-containing protein [Fructobacillus ficulneus]GAP00315.1 membrane protein [Fructobacillus ficulneus]
MPKNFKEELLFMIMMAGLMVLGMTTYNVFLHQGLDNLAKDTLLGYPLGLLVAMICDGILVGPIAKAIAFKAIVPKFAKPSGAKIGITISVLMVLGMVTCMSVFGILVSGNSLSAYPKTWGFNIIVALPLQLAIVGPIARAGLTKIQGSAQ